MTGKKIAIVEFIDNHYDFVIATYRVLKSKNVDVYIFIDEAVYDNMYKELDDYSFNINNDRIIVFDKNKSLKKRLKSIDKYRFNLIIFNSILQDKKMFNYCYYFLRKKNKIYLSIHNINSWINFGRFNYKNLVRFPLKKIILKNCDGIILLNNKLKEYFENNSSKKSFIIPFKIPSNKYINCSYESNKINFLIPGEVDQNKRDYIPMLKMFENLFEDFNDIKLTLLGKLNDSKLEKYIKKIVEKYPEQLNYFTKYIPQNEFKEEMMKSTFLLSSLKKTLYYDRTCAREYYGVTKASGVEFDAIKYGKPLIINSYYKVNSIMNNSTIYYTNFSDLEKKLSEVVKDIKFVKSIEKKAEINSRKFFEQIVKFREKILETI